MSNPSINNEICGLHGEIKTRLGTKLVCLACLAEKTKGKVDSIAEHNILVREQAIEHAKTRSGIPLIYHTATIDDLDLPRDEVGAQSFTRVARAMARFSGDFDRFRRERAGFLFTGDAGTGKTHVACAIANRLLERGHTVAYTSLPALTLRVRSSYSNESGRESIRQIVARCSIADLFILDEIDLHGGGMGDFQVLYEILNNRYASGFRPTIAISNQSKAFLLKDLGDRIVDRVCGASPEVVFNWLPFRGAVQTQKTKAGNGKTESC